MPKDLCYQRKLNETILYDVIQKIKEIDKFARYRKKRMSENCNLFYDHDSLRRVNLSSLNPLTNNVEIIIIDTELTWIYNLEFLIKI